jgi:hypothetical protein
MSGKREPGVRPGKRVCRYCRREYRAVVGEKVHACPECAPRLLDVPPRPRA